MLTTLRAAICFAAALESRLNKGSARAVDCGKGGALAFCGFWFRGCWGLRCGVSSGGDDEENTHSMVVVVVVVSRAQTLPRTRACPAQKSTTFSPHVPNPRPRSNRPTNSPKRNLVEKKSTQTLTTAASEIPGDPPLVRPSFPCLPSCQSPQVARQTMVTISTRRTS